MSNFFTSFESGLDPVEDVIVSQEELENGVLDAAFEADSAEIDKLVAEAEAADAEGDNGGKASELIEKIEEVVADAKDEEGEGVDATAAEAAGIALEAIMLLAGSRNAVMERNKESFEAFESVNTRGAATQVAIEGIKEMAKKVWDTIVKAYKKVVGFMKSIFQKIVGFFTSNEKKIVKMREVVKNLDAKGVKPANDKVKVKFSNVIKPIAEGKPAAGKAKAVPSDGPAACNKAVSLFESAGGIVGSVQKFVDNCESNPKLDKAVVAKTFKDTVLKGLESNYGKHDKIAGQESGSGVAYYGPFAGYKYIRVEADESNGKISVGGVTESDVKEEEAEVPTLSTSEMFKLLDGAAALAKSSAGGKKMISASESALKAIEKAAASAQKMASQNTVSKAANTKGDITDVKALDPVKELEKAVRAATSLNGKLGTYTLTTVNSTMSAALKWVDLSVKEYTKGKEDAEKDKK